MLPLLIAIAWSFAGVIGFWLLAVAAASNYWPFRKWNHGKTGLWMVFVMLGPIGLLVMLVGFKYVRARSTANL